MIHDPITVMSRTPLPICYPPTPCTLCIPTTAVLSLHQIQTTKLPRLGKTLQHRNLALLPTHFVTYQMHLFLSSYQSHCLFLSLCHTSFLFVSFSPHCLSECLYFCPCARRSIKTKLIWSSSAVLLLTIHHVCHSFH